jgi:hypothetical protein
MGTRAAMGWLYRTMITGSSLDTTAANTPAKALRALDAFIVFMESGARAKLPAGGTPNVAPGAERRQGNMPLKVCAGRRSDLLERDPRAVHHGDDLDLAAQRVDVPAQRRDQVIIARFDARQLRLRH